MSEAARERQRCRGVLELRAIRDLLSVGWSHEDICLDRGFSLSTLYRRLERLERLRAKLPRQRAC